MDKDDLAKLHFIADSMKHTFWGSDPKEQGQIDMIRAKMSPYLYTTPPQELFDELIPVARELLKSSEFDDFWQPYRL